jgi:molybdopterin/thiamine biosynthesis adenylyltransferase
MKYGRRKEKRQRRQRTSGPSTASTPSTGPTGTAATAQGPPGGTAVEPWWEREPERLQYELKELDDAGIAYRVDEAAKAKGILIINLEITLADEGKVCLQARFPDFYPYFRFEIRAPELDLPYHQHPFCKQLCVLGRATENWKTTDTLAAFVKERVPQVLATARMESGEEARDVEEHQGEPFSDYYPYLDDSLILIDGTWNVATTIGGSLIVGLPESRTRGLALRGAVLEIRDEGGKVIAKAQAEIRSLFPRALSCRWIRTEIPIQAGKPELFFDGLYQRSAQLEKPEWRTLDGFRYDIIGVVFPEEHQWRSAKTDGWLFAVRAVPVGGTGTGERYTYLIRAGRTGRHDLIERTPELNKLQDKTVVVVGTGALGAPSSIEFARCGIGELRTLDYDYVDPATISRWPLGISAAGLLKVNAIDKFIASNYPYTKVISCRHRVGVCRESEDTESDVAVLRRLIDGADLIYDASAEIGLNHLLSDMAAESQIPYICVSTTYGAWGGRLIRVRSGGKTSGCWMCHFWATERGLIPLPSSDRNGEVQPAGCADPTFTGAGFDVAEIVLGGIRLAVSTLLGDGYPDVAWDVAILTLRDELGSVTVPRWEVFPLERHPECQNFRAHTRNCLDTSQSVAATSHGG